MSDSARVVVMQFCKAWEERDLDELTRLMDDHIVYQNVPGPPMEGKAAALEFITPVVRNTHRIDFELLSIAMTEDRTSVLTERMDRLHFTNGIVEIPIMGIFVIADGKILEWRDYPDSGHVAAQFANLSAPD